MITASKLLERGPIDFGLPTYIHSVVVYGYLDWPSRSTRIFVPIDR